MANVTYFNNSKNELDYKLTADPYYESVDNTLITFSSKEAGDTTPTDPITLTFDPPVGIFSSFVNIPQLQKERLGNGFTATAYNLSGEVITTTKLASLPNDKQLYDVGAVTPGLGLDFAVPFTKEIRRVLIVRDTTGGNTIRKIVLTPEKGSDDYIYYRVDRIAQQTITAPPSAQPSPAGTVVFSPDITSLEFDYIRGSNVIPAPITVNAQNTSATNGFSMVFKTNSEIIITPSTLNLIPLESKTFTINVLESLYQKLGDGVSDIDLTVQITPI